MTNPFKDSVVKKEVYHGTQNGTFTQFSLEKRGTGADQLGFGDFGNGVYFSPKKTVARGYATGGRRRNKDPYIVSAFVDVKKPFIFDVLHAFDKRVTSIIIEKGWKFKINYQKIYKELGTNAREIKFFKEIEDMLADNFADFNVAEKLKKRGYDGLIYGYEIVVFNPKQIQIIGFEKIDLKKPKSKAKSK